MEMAESKHESELCIGKRYLLVCTAHSFQPNLTIQLTLGIGDNLLTKFIQTKSLTVLYQLTLTWDIAFDCDRVLIGR
jgi:hypothetical protein